MMQELMLEEPDLEPEWQIGEMWEFIKEMLKDRQ